MMNASEARKITNAVTEKKETLVKALAIIADITNDIHLFSIRGKNSIWYEFENTEKEICDLIKNLLIYKYGYTVKQIVGDCIEIAW